MIKNQDFEKYLKGEPVLVYVYKKDEVEFTNTTFNMSESDEPFRFASIEDVEAELGTGEDDVYEYPILVQEGVFVWDDNDMEYKK